MGLHGLNRDIFTLLKGVINVDFTFYSEMQFTDNP
jgi:hypothetical protein